MSLSLLSGVRNRKTHVAAAREQTMSFDGSEIIEPQLTLAAKLWDYISGNALLRRFNFRVHKFMFQWDLFIHLSICITALLTFAFTGNRAAVILPISVWSFYNVLFLIGTKWANMIIPGFRRFKHSFKLSIEEFFSPKLLPILSISYLLVTLSLSVTGKRLGGPPLCYSKCSVCLPKWENSIPIDKDVIYSRSDLMRTGCGYVNGRELLGFYTMAQTSFLLFIVVIIAMAVCMAWRVAEDELTERNTAEEWLKNEDHRAYLIRDEIMTKCGAPATSIRPEGNAIWVFYGIVAAISFTLLGWHNWYVLPPSHTASLLIVLNLLTILSGTLILHLGFFGRLISLYQRNLNRVQALTACLQTIGLNDQQLDAWWNCRSFVLNDDLAIDYDLGGLAVSATFLINVMLCVVLCTQVYREGFQAMMEPPGSYCAYACLYITMCLFKLLTIAISTYEEQYRHIPILQDLSSLARGSNSSGSHTNTNTHNPSNANNNDCNPNHTAIGAEIYDFDGLYIEGNNSHHSTDYLMELGSQLRSMGIATAGANSDSRDEDDAINSPPSGGENNTLAQTQGGVSSSGSSSRQNLMQLSMPISGSLPLHAEQSITTPGGSSRIKAMSEPVDIGMVRSESSMLRVPQLVRSISVSIINNENRSQGLAEMVSQIRKYDPYPCILGIPVMPALFSSCKFYIFVMFLLLGARIMVSVLRVLLAPEDPIDMLM